MVNLNMMGRGMTLQGMVRDVLPLALTLALGMVVVAGLSRVNLADMLQTSLANATPRMLAAHSRSQAEQEIKQRFDEGVALLSDKQYEPALKAFHRVLQLSPEMPEAYVNAGYALLGQKQFAVARDFFEGAIDLRPEQFNAYFGLAEALDGMNDFGGALGAMRTYNHLAPPADPFRRKAEAAIYEFEFKLKTAREQAGGAQQDGAPR